MIYVRISLKIKNTPSTNLFTTFPQVQLIPIQTLPTFTTISNRQQRLTPKKVKTTNITPTQKNHFIRLAFNTDLTLIKFSTPRNSNNIKIFHFSTLTINKSLNPINNTFLTNIFLSHTKNFTSRKFIMQKTTTRNSILIVPLGTNFTFCSCKIFLASF